MASTTRTIRTMASTKAARPPRFGYAIRYVPSVDAALAFYEEAFGLTKRLITPEGKYGELDTGATALAFVELSYARAMLGGEASLTESDPKCPPLATEVGLVVDDVDAAFERAVAAGATATVAPATKPWGQRVAYVRDRDGFLVELCTEMV